MKHSSFAIFATIALCHALGGVDTDITSFITVRYTLRLQLLPYIQNTSRAHDTDQCIFQEPTYVQTYFTIHEITDKEDLLAPGYVFIDPVHGAPKIGIGGTQSGPQIREQDGTLVWYGGRFDAFGSEGEYTGTGAPIRERVQDFHVCDYLGSKGTHLCWSERPWKGERKKIVVDQWYALVKELSTGYTFEGGVELSNMHEFNMVDDGHHYLQPAW